MPRPPRKDDLDKFSRYRANQKQRGDLKTVARSHDYDKPCPAFVIQTDHLPETNSALVFAAISSDGRQDHGRAS